VNPIRFSLSVDSIDSIPTQHYLRNSLEDDTQQARNLLYSTQIPRGNPPPNTGNTRGTVKQASNSQDKEKKKSSFHNGESAAGCPTLI
jgi:hypothetical protein